MRSRDQLDDNIAAAKNPRFANMSTCTYESRSLSAHLLERSCRSLYAEFVPDRTFQS